MRLGGFVLAYPKETEFKRKKYLWMFWGGPIASIVAFVVCLVVFMTVTERSTLFFGILFASILFLFSLAPYRTGGVASDGYWIQRLTFHPADAEQELAVLRIYAMYQQDIVATDWPVELVGSLRAVQGATLEAISARMLEITYAIALGDDSLAVTAADELEEVYEVGSFVDASGMLSALVYLDAAFVRAYAQRDSQRARELLERAGTVPQDLSFLRLEVLGRVHALEGDWEAARGYVEEATVAVDRVLLHQPQIAASIKGRLQEILVPMREQAETQSRSTH